MRTYAFIALGLGFILMGAALYALTLRKPAKPLPAAPSKTQLREQAALDEEKKKMRIGAAVVAAFGLVVVVLTLL